MAANTGKRSRRVKARKRSAKTIRSTTAENLVVFVTNEDYEALCREQVLRLPSRLRSAVSVRSIAGEASSSSQPTLILSRLADLSRSTAKEKPRALTTRQVVFINDLPIEAVTARLMSLQIRSSRRLHIAAKPDRASEGEFIYRLVSGMAKHNESETIVDAWVELEDLVLLSPCFQRMVVPSKKLTRFLGNDSARLSKFEIDEDGRFLHWPHSDTHLGWKQLKQLIDPSAAIEDVKETEQFKQRYGGAVRTLRESSGLKQTDVAGLTPRHLRRIEHGEQTVSRRALVALTAAHSISVEEYLRRLADLASCIGSAGR